MKKISLFFVLFVCLILLHGCYATDFVSYNNEKYSPTDKCIVMEDISKCEYENTIFGMIQKKARTTITTPQGALESLIDDAKEYGADAITSFNTSVNRIEKPTILAQNIDVVSAKLIRFMRNPDGSFIKKKN